MRLGNLFSQPRPAPAPAAAPPQDPWAQFDAFSMEKLVGVLGMMLDQAMTKLSTGARADAVKDLDALITCAGRQEKQRPGPHLGFVKAMAISEKAQVMLEDGAYTSALPLFEMSMLQLESLRGPSLPSGSVEPCLAQSFFGHGVAAGMAGNHALSKKSFTKAAALFDTLVKQQGRRDLASLQAKAHLNLGTAYAKADHDFNQAVTCIDEAIAILYNLVHYQGRRDLYRDYEDAIYEQERYMDLAFEQVQKEQAAAEGPVLDQTPVNEANELLQLGIREASAKGPLAGLVAIDKSIALFEEAVYQQKHVKSSNSLADAYAAKARLLASQNDPRALIWFDKAIDLQEYLTRHDRDVNSRYQVETTREQRTAAAATILKAQRKDPGPAEWEIDAEFLGEFVVEDNLALGDLGSVYLVSSTKTKELFAAKRLRLPTAEGRQAFRADMQTWIDLPAHPNLVACRQVRTVGDEEVVFIEYVDGCNLAELIESQEEFSLGQLLDIAIQTATGLQAIHDRGATHLDFKPANVIWAAKDVARITDIGLARARVKGSSGKRAEYLDAIGVTKAYCAPEQAAGLPLTPKADIWSWGASMLHLMRGYSTWNTEVSVIGNLDDFLELGPLKDCQESEHTQIVGVLRKCFHEDPAQRWPALGDAAAALTAISRK